MSVLECEWLCLRDLQFGTLTDDYLEPSTPVRAFSSPLVDQITSYPMSLILIKYRYKYRFMTSTSSKLCKPDTYYTWTAVGSYMERCAENTYFCDWWYAVCGMWWWWRWCNWKLVASLPSVQLHCHRSTTCLIPNNFCIFGKWKII